MVYGSFWTVIENSKEGDVLECEYPGYQKIINNGDHTFMWKESWEVVKLSGEFLGLKWKVVSK